MSTDSTASLPGSDRPIEIAPSVLPADFANMGEACSALEAAGVDRIHWDVMDGQYVPNMTFGPGMIAACRPHTSLPFEAHLMILGADDYLDQYIDAGCTSLTVHAEAVPHLHRTLGRIAELGATPAVSLNPATPASAIEHVLDLCGLVLVMTVNPGFGGQSYIAPMERKVAEIRRMIIEGGHDCDIQVDGGISISTAPGAAAAGANTFVAGSAVFKDPKGLEHAVSAIRSAAEKGRTA